MTFFGPTPMTVGVGVFPLEGQDTLSEVTSAKCSTIGTYVRIFVCTATIVFLILLSNLKCFLYETKPIERL